MARVPPELIQFRLERPVADRLRRLAEQSGIPVAVLIRDCLARHLEDVAHRSARVAEARQAVGR